VCPKRVVEVTIFSRRKDVSKTGRGSIQNGSWKFWSCSESMLTFLVMFRVHAHVLVSDEQSCVSDEQSCVSGLPSCVSDLQSCVSGLQSCVSDLQPFTSGGGCVQNGSWKYPKRVVEVTIFSRRTDVSKTGRGSNYFFTSQGCV
jgi:hypothetical protein